MGLAIRLGAAAIYCGGGDAAIRVSAEADRISKRFLKMVEGVFRQRGTIVEKYDVCSRRADIGGEMRFGYHTNEPGFGWTNAVYTALYDQVHR